LRTRLIFGGCAVPRRYNIPKLNFHLYRLGVFEVNLPTPFDFGNGRFSIDLGA
jgi:hypothetical protein